MAGFKFQFWSTKNLRHLKGESQRIFTKNGVRIRTVWTGKLGSFTEIFLQVCRTLNDNWHLLNFETCHKNPTFWQKSCFRRVSELIFFFSWNHSTVFWKPEHGIFVLTRSSTSTASTVRIEFQLQNSLFCRALTLASFWGHNTPPLGLKKGPNSNLKKIIFLPWVLSCQKRLLWMAKMRGEVCSSWRHSITSEPRRSN